jgi:hypothetical protein
MKNAVLWDVALVRTNVSEEHSVTSQKTAFYITYFGMKHVYRNPGKCCH